MRRWARRRLVVAAFVAATSLALASCGDDDGGGSGGTNAPTETTEGTAAGAGDVTIVIDDVAFTTPDVTVPVGGSVTFDNQDNQPHTAKGDSSAFDTGRIDPGVSETVTFDEAGTFPFICSFHPFMKGTVTVE